MRTAGIGVAILGVALIGGAVLVATDDKEGESRSAESTTGSQPALTELLADEETGLKVQHPGDWRRSEREGIVNLESRDRCVALALSAPAPASAAGQLFDDSIAALRRSFKQVRARPPTRAAEIGGAPTETSLVAVREGGRAIAIEVSVSRGEVLSHVSQIVIRDPACGESLGQLREVVASIEYRR